MSKKQPSRGRDIAPATAQVFYEADEAIRKSGICEHVQGESGTKMSFGDYTVSNRKLLTPRSREMISHALKFDPTTKSFDPLVTQEALQNLCDRFVFHFVADDVNLETMTLENSYKCLSTKFCRATVSYDAREGSFKLTPKLDEKIQMPTIETTIMAGRMGSLSFQKTKLTSDEIIEAHLQITIAEYGGFEFWFKVCQCLTNWGYILPSKVMLKLQLALNPIVELIKELEKPKTSSSSTGQSGEVKHVMLMCKSVLTSDKKLKKRKTDSSESKSGAELKEEEDADAKVNLCLAATAAAATAAQKDKDWDEQCAQNFGDDSDVEISLDVWKQLSTMKGSVENAKSIIHEWKLGNSQDFNQRAWPACHLLASKKAIKPSNWGRWGNAGVIFPTFKYLNIWFPRMMLPTDLRETWVNATAIGSRLLIRLTSPANASWCDTQTLLPNSLSDFWASAIMASAPAAIKSMTQANTYRITQLDENHFELVAVVTPVTGPHTMVITKDQIKCLDGSWLSKWTAAS